MDLEINKSLPVAVTGATGYVAGQIIHELLSLGLTVHGTVRNPKNTEKLKHLNALAEKSPGSIEYFQGDLLTEGSFDACFNSCSIVFHTASPFALDVQDPQKDLVDPALKGTINALTSVGKSPSVRRVVLTSSCAAVYGDNADRSLVSGGVFSESDWNTTSSLIHNPYSFSKTLAEKKAWEISEQQDQWDLVTINPSFVMGPGVNPYGTSESFHMLKQLGDGTMRSGCPDWGVGVVDVRDVAQAHIRAAFLPKAKGRHIVSGHNTSFPGMIEPLIEQFGDSYPLPRRILPKWLVWTFGPLVNKAMTRKSISLNVGYPWQADNSKSRKELGLTYRPLKETMVDFFNQLIDSGQI